ncbi:MAG TPA: PH domain-containing protein [Micromonosporaceae bacterium]|nr:PH domain-containing protein [Micromonosporaceae bacterium]
MTEPHVLRVRPHRIRLVCWVAAALVVIVFTAIGTSLRGPIADGAATFQAGDQWAMIGLGVLGALAVLALTRPRVLADTERIKIRNVIGGYELPWDVVRAVRFERGAPWATLELQDDDVVAVMAVQAADKERAVVAVRELRALLAAHRATAGG